MEEKHSASAEATYSKLRVLEAIRVVFRWEAGILSGQAWCTSHPRKTWSLQPQSLLSVSGLWHLRPISVKISKLVRIFKVQGNACVSGWGCVQGWVCHQTHCNCWAPSASYNVAYKFPSTFYKFHKYTQAMPGPPHLSTFHCFYSLPHFQHMQQVCSTNQGTSAHSPAP